MKRTFIEVPMFIKKWKETIYFINVYAKNEKDDLTEEEKKAFKAVVKFLKEE